MFPLSHGNKKLGKDTMILNMTPAENCPSKSKNLCQMPNGVTCYARKAERCYPSCLPYRKKQEKLWNTLTVEQIFQDIKSQVGKSRKHMIKYIRFSECGDFKSQKDVDKMSELADKLKTIDIILYGYTARSDLTYDNKSDNMIVNGSSFKVDNEFKAIPKEARPKKNEFICPGNCRYCRACKGKNGLKILCWYH